MSALPPKADMDQHARDVRFVPDADMPLSAARRALGDDVDDFKRHHYFAQLIDYLDK